MIDTPLNAPGALPVHPYSELVSDEAPPRDLRDYLAMFSRRRTGILVVLFVIAAIAVAVATLLPPVYRSTATILIQEQEIPADLVRSTITSFADTRIQTISQQIMTRSVLLGLVDKYRLYDKRRRFSTNEEILEEMRKDIKLESINARITDRSSGGVVNGTIAFQISYNSASPQAAQQVTNDLVTLYLNENVRTRQERAAETAAFLSEEADRLGAQISENESKLATFKARNQGRLPESMNVNLSTLDRISTEMSRLDQQIASAEDRKIQLTTQIAEARALTKPDQVAVRPNYAVTSGTPVMVMEPADRLKYLQDQLAGMLGNYAETHPDIVRIRREITVLKADLGEDKSSEDYATEIETQKAQLDQLRQKYSEDHPDVVKARNALARLEQAQANAEAQKNAPGADSGTKRAKATSSETRFVLTMRTQLDSTNREIANLRASREELQSKARAVEARLNQGPQIEKEYLDLQRDHENLLTRYRELKNKQMTAQVAESLEKDRKAERFSLIDPPQLPERPVSPNRPVVLLVGMLLSIAGGVGWGFLRETLDRSVKGIRELRRLVVVPVLGSVPLVEGAEDRDRRRRSIGLIAGVVVLLLVLALALVHFVIMPLPVLWYVVLRQLAIG
jgi:polysaccharide biosynthesis transport protein